MIKQFSAGDITTRPFGTFKHWTLQSMDTDGQDQYGYSTYYSGALEVNRGQHLTSIFYPSGSMYYNSLTEPINPSGKYYRNVYSLANSMFYEFSGNPLTTFGVQEHNQDLITGTREMRKIDDSIITVTLKHNVFGDSVSPGAIRIVDNSNIHETYCIYDDEYTNLYITGSHFPITTKLGGVRDLVATPRWVSSSGEFYVTFSNGNTTRVNLENAKYYMDMGLEVTYDPPSGSDWTWDQSTARDYFQANNEHFGESISSWYKYVLVGSSMDNYSLSTNHVGYAALFKYDDSSSYHRLVKKINFPFTQSVNNTSSYFQDSFGYSVAVRDNFLAIGSPTGSACNTSNYRLCVCIRQIQRWNRFLGNN